MSKSFSHLYNTLLIRGAYSLFDQEFRKRILEKAPWKRWFDEDYPEMPKCQDEYLDRYPEWIASSKLNQFYGLETFPNKHLINGVTQMLDEFHFQCLKKGRRLRFFRGEYPYNQNAVGGGPENFIDEDHPLQKGDAVIISCPFSATGDIHTKFQWLMDECHSLNVSVAVDCAFFGTCGGISVDLSHPCIERVAFSLTKGTGSGNYRSGIEFSKDHEGHIAIQNDWHHNLHLHAAIGLFLMNEFSPDYIHSKYRSAQEAACLKYGLTPTPCIHLALGGEGWEYFNRDEIVNRVGIRRIVQKEYKERQKKVLMKN